MSNWFSKNFWLKVIALALAVITWYYVEADLERMTAEERAPFWFATRENIVKEVKIVPVIVGQPPQGYVVRAGAIRVKPDAIFIIGPKRVIDNVVSVKTVEIDVNGQTRTFNLTVPLELVRSVRFYGQSGVVDVTIPIDRAPAGP